MHIAQCTQLLRSSKPANKTFHILKESNATKIPSIPPPPCLPCPDWRWFGALSFYRRFTHSPIERIGCIVHSAWDRNIALFSLHHFVHWSPKNIRQSNRRHLSEPYECWDFSFIFINLIRTALHRGVHMNFVSLQITENSPLGAIHAECKTNTISRQQQQSVNVYLFVDFLN